MWGFLQSTNILDLPDELLEQIAQQLETIEDVTSCVVSCKKPKELCLPQRSSMVCAKQLGKEWALRACGKALWAFAGYSWDSDELRCVDSLNSELPEQLLQIEMAIAMEAVQSKMFLKPKAVLADIPFESEIRALLDEVPYSKCLAVVWIHAELQGFGEIADFLSGVVQQASDLAQDELFWSEFVEAVQSMRDNDNKPPFKGEDLFHASQHELSASLLFEGALIEILPKEMMWALRLVVYLFALDFSFLRACRDFPFLHRMLNLWLDPTDPNAASGVWNQLAPVIALAGAAVPIQANI